MLWKPTTSSSSPARRWLAPAILSLSAMPLALFTPGTLHDPKPEIAVRPAMNAAHFVSPATRLADRPTGARAAGASTTRRPAIRPRSVTLASIQNPKSKTQNSDRRIYRLSYTNAAESDLRALFAGRTSAGSGAGLTHVYRTRVEGEWVATVLDPRGAKVRTAVHLRRTQGVPAVRLWVDGHEAPVQASSLSAELGRDMVVTTDAAGRVLTVQFDPGMSVLSQGYIRALLGLTQFVLPSNNPKSNAWTAEEEDPNGRYIARYQVELGRPGGASAVQTVRKQKLRYLQARRRVQGVNEEIRPTALPSGALVARIDRQRGLLLSLTGAETQSLVMRGTKVGRSVTGLRLQYLGPEKVGAAERAALRRALAAPARRPAAQRLSSTGSREASEAAIQRNQLGDATLESLLAALARADAEAAAARAAGNQPGLSTPLYLKLKALVYLHPEHSSRLGALLAGADPNRVMATLVTGALGAVGHPQAQAALVDAIRSHSRNSAALAQELAALAGVAHPTPLAEATMRDQAAHAPTRDLRVMADLALGTMARNLTNSQRPEETRRAARIVDEIVRKLAAAHGEAARLQLMALGNAGSARALPAIDRFLADRSPILRASAAAALRFIDDARVDARLTRCLAGDPAPEVRGEAAGALGFRVPTAATLAAQQRAFRAERAEGVRLAILSNLGRAETAFPRLRDWIQGTAAHDPSPNVRKAAANLLTASPRRS
jgi:hypothetical protein